MPPLLDADRRKSYTLRVMRHADLRYEAAAVLLGNLPIQGQAEAGAGSQDQRGHMSEVFFIGDTHFGHRGIIQFSETAAHRPFSTIEEHDAELVRRWNSVVGPKDMVWHLGDFCFGKRNLEIAVQINGNKKLVMGNHDMYATEDYLRYITRLAGLVEYKGLVLSHAPLQESQLARWYMNVHGYLHTKRNTVQIRT